MARCAVVPKVGDGFEHEASSAATGRLPGSEQWGYWLLSCPRREEQGGDNLHHVLMVTSMLLWLLL